MTSSGMQGYSLVHLLPTHACMSTFHDFSVLATPIPIFIGMFLIFLSSHSEMYRLYRNQLDALTLLIV